MGILSRRLQRVGDRARLYSVQTASQVRVLADELDQMSPT